MAEDIDQRIAHRAYDYFLARGGEHGHHVEDWLAAETDLTRTPYDAVLVVPGDNPIELVRTIRDRTGMALAEVRALIDTAPQVIRRLASLVEAELFAAAIEAAGARIELRKVRT